MKSRLQNWVWDWRHSDWTDRAFLLLEVLVPAALFYVVIREVIK